MYIWYKAIYLIHYMAFCFTDTRGKNSISLMRTKQNRQSWQLFTKNDNSFAISALITSLCVIIYHSSCLSVYLPVFQSHCLFQTGNTTLQTLIEMLVLIHNSVLEIKASHALIWACALHWASRCTPRWLSGGHSIICNCSCVNYTCIADSIEKLNALKSCFTQIVKIVILINIVSPTDI